MAVNSVYELAIPSEHAASFVNGERALSVSASIGAATGRTNFFLSKWFDLQGGLYTLRSIAQDAALWMTSVSANNSRTFFNSHAAQGVIDAQVYLPAGRHRIDLILSNVSTGASSCYVAFSLAQDNKLVYASAGTGWVFDTAPIADSAVPAAGDARLTLPVFSVYPNWANPVVERLDFKTEVMASESDDEQRRSLRRFPRRSFEATFTRHDVRRARLSNFLIGSGNNEVLVPLWHEQHTLSSILGSSVQFPEGELALREFSVGDLVMVSRGNPVEHELLTVASVDTINDMLGFTAAPVGSWPEGSRIFPVRRARVLDVGQMDNVTDRAATVQIRFALVEPEQWPTPSWGYCSPLFTFPVNWATPVSNGITRPTASQIDSDYGVTEVHDPYARTRLSVRAAMTLRGRARVYAFRQFLQSARGRAVRFWMPSLTDDLRVVGTTGGDYLDVDAVGLAEYLQRTQEVRSMLAFEPRNGGSTVYRRIARVEDNGSTERVFLAKPVPDFTASSLRRLSFIMPSRFDQDGFEFQHIVDGSKVVQTSIVVRSTDSNGMPGIECVTTSKPYPVDRYEVMGAAASFIAGLIRENPGAREELRGIPALLGGTLIENTESLSDRPMAMQSTVAFLAGDFTGADPQVTASNMAVGSSAALLAGSLVNMLVAYNDAPVGVSVGASLIAGTLAAPGPTIFFGQTDVPNMVVTGQALAARNSFVAAISNPSVLTFESLALDSSPTTASKTASFNAGNSATFTTLDQMRLTDEIGDEVSATGRFDTTNGGGRWLEFRDTMTVAFATAVRAFGFFGTDWGDFNGRVKVRLNYVSGSPLVIDVPHTVPAATGNLIFFGFTSADLISSIDIFCTYDVPPDPGGEDWFGFDDLIIGTPT